MDIKTFTLEIYDLIKSYKKTIVFTAIIVSIISLGIQILLQIDLSNSENGDAEAMGVPAYLEIYIEQENLGAFGNSYLLEIISTQEDVIDTIEKDTGIEIQSVLATFAEDNLPIYTEDDPINIERNTSSNLMYITVEIGSDEENLKVANAYMEWFQNTNSNFFDDKEVYIITEPALIDIEELGKKTEGISTSSLILPIVAGIVIGSILGLIISLLKVLVNEKIIYGFAYGWNPNDLYIKKLNKIDSDQLVHDILIGNSDSIAIISQEKLSSEVTDKLMRANRQEGIFNNISAVPIEKNIEEFVIVIERNKTSKEWYNTQRNTLKLYPHSRVKIIEI